MLFNPDNYDKPRKKPSRRRARARLAAKLRRYVLIGFILSESVALGSAGYELSRTRRELANLRQSIQSRHQELGNSNLTKVSKNSGESGTARRVTDEKGNIFDAFVVDVDKTPIRIHYLDAGGERFGTFKRLKEYIEASGDTLIFATNGGMFHPDGSPVGLLTVDSKEITPLNLKAIPDGNFYLTPNGVFGLTKKEAFVRESTQFNKMSDKEKIIFATQSGPMLVINGKVHPKFRKTSSNLNIRSGVGIINSNQVVFAISETKVNLYDFAMIFKDQFKCTNALYLDGFISRMYLPALERLDLDGDFGGIIAVSK